MKILKIFLYSTWKKKDTDEFKGGKPPKKPSYLREVFNKIMLFVKLFWVNLTIKNLIKYLCSWRTIFTFIATPTLLITHKFLLGYFFDLIHINLTDLHLYLISAMFAAISRSCLISLIEQTIWDYKGLNPDIKLNPEISNVALYLTPEELKSKVYDAKLSLEKFNIYLMELQDGEGLNHGVKEKIGGLLNNGWILKMKISELLNPDQSPQPIAGPGPSAPLPQPIAEPRPIAPRPIAPLPQPIAGARPIAPLPENVPVPSEGTNWRGVVIHRGFRLVYHNSHFAYGEVDNQKALFVSNPTNIREFSSANINSVNEKNFINDIHNGLTYLNSIKTSNQSICMLDDVSRNYLKAFCTHKNIYMPCYNTRVFREELLRNINKLT